MLVSEVASGAYQILGRPSQADLPYLDLLVHVGDVVTGRLVDKVLVARNRRMLTSDWIQGTDRTMDVDDFDLVSSEFIPTKVEWRPVDGDDDARPHKLEIVAFEQLDDKGNKAVGYESYCAFYDDYSTIAFSDLETVIDQREYRIHYEPLSNKREARARAASGTWSFNTNPVNNETIAVNGVTFTFKYPTLTVAGAGQINDNGDYTARGYYAGNPYWQLIGQSVFGTYSIIKNYTSGVMATPPPDPNFWEITNDEADLDYIEDQDGDSQLLPYSDNVIWTTGGDSSATGGPPVPTVTKGTLTSVQVEIGGTSAVTAANFVAALNASTNTSINVAAYAVSLTTSRETVAVVGTYTSLGTVGNSFTMAASSSGTITVSGDTFTGGRSSNSPTLVTDNTLINDAFLSLCKWEVVYRTLDQVRDRSEIWADERERLRGACIGILAQENPRFEKFNRTQFGNKKITRQGFRCR